MGISLGISITISMILPFPISLVVIIGVFIFLSRYRRKVMMKRIGAGKGLGIFNPGIGSGKLKYYCMTCGTTDGKFPTDWQYIFDPLETLTFVAGNTEKIALGTSVIDILFHNPVILARRFATLDVLSGGRAIAGCGIGWSRDEYQVSGVPFEKRGIRADEYIQMLKKIWTDDVVEFKGQFYNIPASKIGPEPIQKPHIPIYLGGYSQNTIIRIADYANGWICVIRHSLDEAKSSINKIRNEYRKAKKDPKDIHIAAILYPNVIDSGNADIGRHRKQHLLNGSVDQVGK